MNRYSNGFDGIVFSSKSGVAQLEREFRNQLIKKLSVPTAILVQAAESQVMIKDDLASLFSTIFKREPFVDLDRYSLTLDNKNKIAPTILANPLSPLFAKAPWLENFRQPSQLGFNTQKEYDTFFIGRVGKNRYENRLEACKLLTASTQINFCGGLIPSNSQYPVPKPLQSKPFRKRKYKEAILKSKTNIALDGIGGFTFRHLELLWSGSLCLSETDLSKIWLREPIVDGQDYITFSSYEDMIDKIIYFSKNTREAIDVARSGREYYEKLYDARAHGHEILAELFST